MHTKYAVELGSMMVTLDVDALEARIVRRWGMARHAWGGHAVWALTVGGLVTLAINVAGCVS